MKEGIWNIILHKKDKESTNKLITPNNNPTESGRYLCTCVQYWNDEEIRRYLQIMEYDAKKRNWHDCGNQSGISHNILAWTNEVPICAFDNYNYIIGGHFIEK